MRNSRTVTLALRACSIACLLLALGGAGALASTPGHPQPTKHKKVTKKHKKVTKKHKKVTKKPAADAKIRYIPVTFSVVNDDTSQVVCPADGKTYTVSGTLVLPVGATPSAVTTYVHGLGYGAYFWHFTAVPGYDYVTTEAQHGHASLTIDRLGYGSSSIPNGTQTCVGSQATMLHEIVGDLRSGHYTSSALKTVPSFSRIGLVGHSAGGQLAEIEAFSYNDINALGVVEWNDGDYSGGTYAAFTSDIGQCSAGGEDQVGSNSAGYAQFGTTDATYNALMFFGIDPKVQAAADKLRTLDPCGQIESVLSGVAVDAVDDANITVPIIFVHAEQDGIFPIGLPWATLQEALYAHTAKLTDLDLPNAGHAVTLENTSAAPFAAGMNSWLTTNGL